MIIYEVNLIINNEIYNEYYSWLLDHVKTMLTFRGFKHAEIGKEKIFNIDDTHMKLTVRYALENEQDLENYLTHHAQSMREDGIRRFGNQVNVTRRVFIHSFTII